MYKKQTSLMHHVSVLNASSKNGKLKSVEGIFCAKLMNTRCLTPNTHNSDAKQHSLDLKLRWKKCGDVSFAWKRFGSI